jgi:hypothetical protein
MFPELSRGLIILFFIIYLGVIWLTILYKLRKIEKMLSDKQNNTDTDNNSKNSV